MSREGTDWQGFAAPVTGSHLRKELGFRRGPGRCRLALFPPLRLAMVRNMVRPVGPPMLMVREVAEELAVCRATVYALLERGELERVWVGRSIPHPGRVA